jgi:hypothetical protein
MLTESESKEEGRHITRIPEFQNSECVHVFRVHPNLIRDVLRVLGLQGDDLENAVKAVSSLTIHTFEEKAGLKFANTLIFNDIGTIRAIDFRRGPIENVKRIRNLTSLTTVSYVDEECKVYKCDGNGIMHCADE